MPCDFFYYAMCHNLGAFKMNVHNGWLRSLKNKQNLTKII